MRLRICASLLFSAVCGILISSSSASAQIFVASDSAADPAYAAGWPQSSNGGSGFFPWTLTNSGDNSGHFVFTSTANGDGDGNGDGDIDTLSRAWGMFANSGETAEAFRGFGKSLTQGGDKFRVSMDNGFVDGGSVVGMGLRNFGGDNRMEFLFFGGSVNYSIIDAAGTIDTGIPFSDEGLDLQIMLTGPNTYDLTVTPLFTGVPIQLPGRTLSGSGDITNFRGFNVNAGSGDTNNLFFNSLQVIAVPEPATCVLLGIGSLLLALSGARFRRPMRR